MKYRLAFIALYVLTACSRAITPDALPKHHLISMLPFCIYMFGFVAFAWVL